VAAFELALWRGMSSFVITVLAVFFNPAVGRNGDGRERAKAERDDNLVDERKDLG
jgi:hypothetical protein